MLRLKTLYHMLKREHVSCNRINSNVDSPSIKFGLFLQVNHKITHKLLILKYVHATITTRDILFLAPRKTEPESKRR